MAKLFLYSRPSAFRSSNRQNSFIRTIKKKQSSEHIAALVTKLANAKVGLVAAGKPASEMFKKKKSTVSAEQKQAYLCCEVEKHFCFSTKVKH